MRHRANVQRILSVLLILLFLFTSHPVPATAAAPTESAELAAWLVALWLPELLAIRAGNKAPKASKTDLTPQSFSV